VIRVKSISEKEFRLKFFKNFFIRLLDSFVRNDPKNLELFFGKGKVSSLKNEKMFKKELEKVSEKLAKIFIKGFEKDEKRMNKIISDIDLLKEWILERIGELESEES